MADERYAKIARYLGLPASTTEEGINSLIKAVQDLMKAVERPMSIKDCGISEAEFMSKVDDLSYKAFEDQCTTANPVYPLVSEIKELYIKAYNGDKI